VQRPFLLDAVFEMMMLASVPRRKAIASRSKHMIAIHHPHADPMVSAEEIANFGNIEPRARILLEFNCVEQKERMLSTYVRSNNGQVGFLHSARNQRRLLAQNFMSMMRKHSRDNTHSDDKESCGLSANPIL
jgi:hypothetical protein